MKRIALTLAMIALFQLFPGKVKVNARITSNVTV